MTTEQCYHHHDVVVSTVAGYTLFIPYTKMLCQPLEGYK